MSAGKAGKAGSSAPGARGSSGGSVRGRRTPVVVAAVVVGALLAGLGLASVAGVGPFASEAAPDTSSPTSSATASASPTQSPSPVDPDEFGPLGTIAAPGACLGEAVVVREGGRQLSSGSCDETHAAESVGLLDGRLLGPDYPADAVKTEVRLGCEQDAFFYLGLEADASQEQIDAYVDALLADGSVVITTAFPSREDWAAGDTGIACLVVPASGEFPPGSIAGTLTYEALTS
jgi:hypothetical protein